MEDEGVGVGAPPQSPVQHQGSQGHVAGHQYRHHPHHPGHPCHHPHLGLDSSPPIGPAAPAPIGGATGASTTTSARKQRAEPLMQYHVVGSESFVHVSDGSFAVALPVSSVPVPITIPIMEQIETQVSDLRYLSQAPVALNSGGSEAAAAGSAGSAYETPRPQGHGSPGSASVGDNSAPSNVGGGTSSHGPGNAGSKRKSVDDGSVAGKGSRSKRNRVSFESFFSLCDCVVMKSSWVASRWVEGGWLESHNVHPVYDAAVRVNRRFFFDF